MSDTIKLTEHQSDSETATSGSNQPSDQAYSNSNGSSGSNGNIAVVVEQPAEDKEDAVSRDDVDDQKATLLDNVNGRSPQGVANVQPLNDTDTLQPPSYQMTPSKSYGFGSMASLDQRLGSTENVQQSSAK